MVDTSVVQISAIPGVLPSLSLAKGVQLNLSQAMYLAGLSFYFLLL